MHTFPVCWGLDIGHASIKAVKLSRHSAQVTVLGYAIEPIAVAEGDDRDAAVIASLRSLVQREEFGSTPVIAALSGRQVLTKSVNIPSTSSKNVERMVEMEARQHVPGDFNDVEWGYHLSPSADGVSNDVALFAVKRELTQELMSVCKQAGIHLAGISISSLGLYNFVRYDQVFPEDETVIILDVGAENTDLVCYQGDTLWMRTLAASGNDITKAFMKKFKVSFEEAEQLKRQAGDSAQAGRIIKMVEGSLNDLTSEVQRSLGFYKSQNPNAKLDNLVISGGTFKLPGLPEHLAERLRYTVNILQDLDRIQVANGLERDHFMHDLQGLGVAMGLALQGTGVAKANVDLMPGEQRIQRLLATKRWAGIAIVAMVAVMLYIDNSVISSVRDENSALIKSIQDSHKTNMERQQRSLDVLANVAPRAAELKSFDVVGTQQGVTSGICAAVTTAVANVAKAVGPVNGPVETRDGKVVPLQAAYLRQITVPPYNSEGPGGPFRPFLKNRVITLVVSIPQATGTNAVIGRLLDGLKDIPVPESLKAAHPAVQSYLDWMAQNPNAAPEERSKKQPKLFSEVQAKSINEKERETYFYVDKAAMDSKTGESKPIEEERTIGATVVTFSCTIKGLEGTP